MVTTHGATEPVPDGITGIPGLSANTGLALAQAAVDPGPEEEGYEPACQVCGVRLETAGTLDLHHVSYAGVIEGPDGRWIAGEADADLVPMCRDHHRRLHRMMDRRGEFYGWDRGRATVVIIAHLRREWTRRLAGVVGRGRRGRDDDSRRR